MGIESYAVINFYAVILALLFFADAGLTATLNRELARSTDKKYLGNLLFTMERIYMIICLLIIIGIFLFSNIIATNWLKSTVIPQSSLALYIGLMGIGISFQFFSTLYNGGLMGLQKQVLANGLQILWSFFRSGVVLLPLYFLPSLTTFFVWQILVNGIFLLITRFKLWELVRTQMTYAFNLGLIRNIWKFALGMMVMGMIAALNTQLDKLLISKMLSLSDFGYYSLAAVFAQSPVIITTPVAVAVVPQLTRLIAEHKREELVKLFQRFSFFIASVAAAVSIVLFLYTKEMLFIWTHDPLIANTVNVTAKILLVGSTFLAFQLMPYYLSIGNGYNKANIKLGVICIICIIPSFIVLIKAFGLLGAAIPWLIINVLATLVLGYVLINKFLGGEFGTWLLKHTIVPCLVAIVVGYVVYYLTLPFAHGYYVLLYGAVTGCLVLLLNVWVHNKLAPDDVINLRQFLPGARRKTAGSSLMKEAEVQEQE
ncbi:oligosaccharide flippase family protein [Chitinophaga varians]|nr:oligosaccharide flippase family protein [Chitinophaga varians]